MKNHFLILRVLYYFFGLAYVILGMFFWAAIYTEFLGPKTSGSYVLLLIPSFLVILSFLAGYLTLHYTRTWIKIFLICFNVMILICVPLGTIIGIYGLWMLNRDEVNKINSKNNF